MVSVIYVVGLGIYSVSEWPNMLIMKPDEFATFLSGVFAPLAFLWLVLGFRQQGDELQNSARALWLQGEELRNSVEQQRQLVEVSREQLACEAAERVRTEQAAESAAQPRLTVGPAGGSYFGDGRRVLTISVTSGGPTCTDARMLLNAADVARTQVLVEGGRLETQVEYLSPAEVEPANILVQYNDLRGNPRQQRFLIPITEAGGPHRDRTLGDPVRLQD
ncbi:hypothetical protein SAMN05428984_2627 [Sphingomonas sp. OK281]|nr:hypothetical protein SAMN05428984_2627 [Sphingomonas sp. OK281]